MAKERGYLDYGEARADGEDFISRVRNHKEGWHMRRRIDAMWPDKELLENAQQTIARSNKSSSTPRGKRRRLSYSPTSRDASVAQDARRMRSESPQKRRQAG